uniref:Uncharacterized protein AlNc14C121G6669 n=1 Tax=Albugo laibachii Nc14 TaxID=890382 RepID=F0WJE1_9STRA|nr:conserved hypothetical protein [Albugo laibachii Nc14]|eukprot:CCA21389.1 conserved hypothetical protein [Albugo laibachii Nc14]
MDNNAQETSKSLHSDEVGVGETICVVLCKKSGENSFGMGLGRKIISDTEKPSSNACQIYVSHVVRNSPAYRENVQEGWRIEQVEGRSIEGYDVQSLASLMRKSYTIKVDFAMSQEEQPDENQDKTQAHMLLLERHRASRPENCSLGFGRASLSKQHRRRVPSDLVDISTDLEDETKIKAASEGHHTDALLHDSSARTGKNGIEKKRKNDAVACQSKACRPNKQTKMTVWATRSNFSKAQLFKDVNNGTSPHVKAMDAPICHPQHLTSSTKIVSECPGKSVEVLSRSTFNAVDLFTPSNNASGSNDVHFELPSQKPTGESNRQRHSLTTRRLIDMGFEKVEAEASVAACGDDLEKCMAWIAAQLEEKQFISDLNQASIQSELSKQKEAVSLKQKEKELLKKAQVFTSLFPNVRRPIVLHPNTFDHLMIM